MLNISEDPLEMLTEEFPFQGKAKTFPLHKHPDQHIRPGIKHVLINQSLVFCLREEILFQPHYVVMWKSQ